MTRMTEQIAIERPTPALLESLTAEREGPCVTMLLKREFAGDASDAIRLKNAIRTATEALRSEGVDAAEAESLLGPLSRLTAERELWQPGTGGVCVYVGNGVLRLVETPECEENVVEAAPSFFIKPVLRAIQNDTDFYVLGLSQGSVRMLRCTMHSCERVDVPDMPGDISEGPRKYKDYERSNQFHTSDRQAGAQTGTWHGQGVGKDDEKVDQQEFFDAVGEALRNAGIDLPIVVACDRQHRSLFRERAGLPNVLAEGPDGNVDHLSDAELHEKAVDPMRIGVEARHREEVERVQAAAEHGRVAATLTTTLESARDGRVDLLLLEDGATVWGRLPDGQVSEHQQRKRGDVELTNEAAIRALRTGGKVRLVDDLAAAGFGGKSPAVALLRW